MQCKNRWERDFLITATAKILLSMVNTIRIVPICFSNRKKVAFPETMPLVENYLKVADERMKKETIKKKIIALRTELNGLRNAEFICSRNIRQYSNGEAGEAKKAEFKRACPVDGCLGFLSTAWKCGVCNIWTCPTCMEIKGPNKDDPHECDPNTVESVKLLKKDTKNCPSCAAMIYKISGCDQMWCTQCHIAFSWRTGRQVNGVIHNPHFYQWQNNGGGGGNVNAPGAAVCGGLPDLYTVRSVWRDFGVPRSKLLGVGTPQQISIGTRRYFGHIEQCIERLTKRSERHGGGGAELL